MSVTDVLGEETSNLIKSIERAVLEIAEVYSIVESKPLSYARWTEDRSIVKRLTIHGSLVRTQ